MYFVLQWICIVLYPKQKPSWHIVCIGLRIKEHTIIHLLDEFPYPKFHLHNGEVKKSRDWILCREWTHHRHENSLINDKLPINRNKLQTYNLAALHCKLRDVIRWWCSERIVCPTASICSWSEISCTFACMTSYLVNSHGRFRYIDFYISTCTAGCSSNSSYCARFIC